MNISRRKALKLSGATVAGSLIGLSVKSQDAKSVNFAKSDKLKIIVFGAHPDDPESGCGGIMAALANEGHEVTAAYLTRGEAGIKGKTYEEAAAIRTQEAEEACKILNARPEFLGQVDGNCEITKEHYRVVMDFLNREQPDIIFNHWPIDTHRDHRICSVLAYDAWLYSGKKSALYYYEVMTGQQSQNFIPTTYVDISDYLKIKQKACFAHKSQNAEEWYAASHAKMEVFRGMESNCPYAEAFIRHYQSPPGLMI